MKNVGASGRFIAMFSIVSLSFLGGLFKFTADVLKKYPDVSRHSARWTVHHCNQTPVWIGQSWMKRNCKDLGFSFFALLKAFFNLESDEILIISVQVIDLQHECINRHWQDRRHHRDGNHNGVTQNSTKGLTTLDEMKAKVKETLQSSQRSQVGRQRRWELYNIFLKYGLPANSIYKRHFQYNVRSI